MKVIVTTITRSPRGNAMRSSREIVADQLRVGRGAECELRLPDPRVPIHARSILAGVNGPQMYDAFEQSADVTGVYRSMALVPGTSLKIGPFRLDVVAPAPGVDLALDIELVQPLPGVARLSGKDIYERARTAPVSRRAVAWLLFLPILLGFLVFPVFSYFADQHKAPTAHAKTLDRARAKAASFGEQSWSPGELAAAHQPFASNCKVCHSQSFTRVQDADCKACHKDMGDHVSPSVAHVQGLSETRCASCHRDHKGAFALQQQNTHYFMAECSTCHADIRKHMAATRTLDVSDFARGHPEFRINLLSGQDKTGISRLRLSDKAKIHEDLGLKFPHDLHLDPKGVKGPQGLVKVECGSCHVPDSTGTGFKPVTMKNQCQSCHELRFEIAAPERQVPHGNVGDVMTTLRDFYSYIAINHIDLDRTRPAPGPGQMERDIPGKTAPGPQRLGNPADVKGQVRVAATELFEKTSCVTCHKVSRTVAANGEPDWQVSPVLAAPRRMPTSGFSHASHTMTACSTCHAAKTSKTAQDVLMPGIETCRSCHAGRNPEAEKVVSNCGLCHGFHVINRMDRPDGMHPMPWPASRDAVLSHSAMPLTAPAVGK